MTDELPEEKIEECKKIFAHYDKNQDGTISVNELGEVMKGLGVNHSQAELQEIIKKIDKDGSGKIEFEELLNLYTGKMKTSENDEELNEIFKILDKEGNGLISTAELRYILTSFRERLTEKEADEVIGKADKDRDGLINYQEYKDIMFTNDE